MGRKDVRERATPDRSECLDDGGVPVDGPERWSGFVFDAALDELGGVFADEPGGEVEAAVDAGGHAGGGEVLAVFDPALVEVLGAEAFEDVNVRPVGGGRPVVEQAGGRRGSVLRCTRT